MLVLPGCGWGLVASQRVSQVTKGTQTDHMRAMMISKFSAAQFFQAWFWTTFRIGFFGNTDAPLFFHSRDQSDGNHFPVNMLYNIN